MVHAGRLAENLQHRAGAEVFLDIESIPPGVSFPEYIEREIESCDAVVVMIGDDWLRLADEHGEPRIADPLDWVHLEIAAALKRGVLTIPALVEGARMPSPNHLPTPLANLAYRNAVELRDTSWRQDTERLIAALPNAEHPASSPTVAPTWPKQFSNSWFAQHVPLMDEAELRALRAELYKRTWTDDEIETRVLVHTRAPPPLQMSAAAAQPQPADQSLQAVAPAWPSRFSDSWFFKHVPAMNSQLVSELVTELHARNWTEEEIAARVLLHTKPGLRSEPTPTVPPPPTASAIVSGEVDERDVVAKAVLEAASDLAQLALDPSSRVRERHLADAIARHLDSAVSERKVYIPNWDPQPGNVDVFTTDWRGRPNIVIETKLKEGNDVFECLWDMAKMLSLETAKSVSAAYLVTGSTVASWERPVACAELFETGRHELVGAITGRYHDWWVKYILGGGRGRPLAIPDVMDVTRVASVRYPVHGIEWELRAVKITAPPNARWVGFSDGLPSDS